MKRKNTGIQQITLPPTRAAIYLRVSTTEQADSGLGLDAQQTRCRAMAEVKGWQVVATYRDEGISGTKDATKRPELARLLEAAKAREIDAVIILSLDRLGRKTKLVLDLVETMASYDVELVSCKESLDTTTATGRFVLSLFASLAQLERDQIAERTTAALTELGNRKGYKGGRVPLGYIRENEAVRIDHQAAPVVQHIFELRWQGQPLRAIATQLNSWGHMPGQGGRKWYASSVREVLTNEPIYRGHARYGSEIGWPAILG